MSMRSSVSTGVQGVVKSIITFESALFSGFDGEGIWVWPEGVVKDSTVSIDSEALTASRPLYIAFGLSCPAFPTR